MKSPLNAALDRKWIEASETIVKLERQLAAERERADRNEANAERYLWVRDCDSEEIVMNTPSEAWDAAIDAQRGK